MAEVNELRQNPLDPLMHWCWKGGIKYASHATGLSTWESRDELRESVRGGRGGGGESGILVCESLPSDSVMC